MWVIKLNSSSFLFILFVNIHSQQKQFSRSAHQMSTVSSPQGMTCWIFKELQFPCGCGYTLEICSKFTTKHLLYDVSYIDLLAFYSSVGYSLLRNCEKSKKLWAYQDQICDLWLLNLQPATNCIPAQNCVYHLLNIFDKFMRQFSYVWNFVLCNFLDELYFILHNLTAFYWKK